MSADTLTPDGAAVTLTTPHASQATSYDVATGFAVPTDNPDEIVVVSAGGAGQGAQVTGYGLDGSIIFNNVLGQPQYATVYADPIISAAGGGGVAVAWQMYVEDGMATRPAYEQTQVISDSGQAGATYQTSGQFDEGQAAIFSAPSGYHLEWVHLSGNPFDPPVASTREQQDFQPNGQPADAATGTPGDAVIPWTSVSIDGDTFTISDNQAQLAGQVAVTVPGEPARAMSQVVAASLTGGHSAAVAWSDSGTDYVSIYDAATNSFGPVAGLDWGGASDLHMVALPDGGFAVSWENGGANKGELFDSTGNGGGILALTGQFAAIDSHGDLYTVGLDSSGNEVVQTYAINGGSSGGGGGGSGGTGGGTTGQTFTSDNNGDVWVGTAGNDTFNLGRGGDWVTGNGGNDTYKFAGIPWAGGHITDFNAGDVLDLTGLMSTTSDTGADGFADGYLKITSDASGNAQVWASYNIPGNAGWWLVETLDGVSASSLTHNGDVISIGSSTGPTDVSTAAANYTAPASVTSITLTGSQQTIDASATSGVTINSNDTGNVLIGGPGNDVFHLGRGGDWATGGAGADTFAYAAIPWAGGTITDFNAAQGDSVDVSGLLANAGFSGTDPFADGYLKYGTDGSGNAQLFADYNLPGNNGWWLVATLDGVSTSSLHYANGLIT